MYLKEFNRQDASDGCRCILSNRRHTHRAPDYPAQRVPGSLVKPVEELVEAIGGEVVR